DHAQAEQNDRGGQADLIEGGNQPDRSGAEGHAAERYKKCVFAADAVTHPAEQEGSQRTDQKAGSEQRNGAEQRRNGVAVCEKLDRQDRGQASENVEVIPLDDVTARRSGDHSSEVRRNTSNSHTVLPLGFKDSSIAPASGATAFSRRSKV